MPTTFKIKTFLEKGFGFKSLINVFENGKRLWTDPVEIGFWSISKEDSKALAEKHINWIKSTHKLA